MEIISSDLDNFVFGFTSFNDEKNSRGIKFELKANDILDFVLNYHYSVRHFKYNKRKKANAQKTRIIILDIDEPQINYPDLESIKNKLRPYNHILSTTKSHQILKNGIICDRYRIIFFCDIFIEDPISYKQQILDISKYFNLECDEKCVDTGRFFYKSQEIISSNFNGKSFKLVLTEKSGEKQLKKKDIALWEANIELTTSMKNWIDRKNLGQRLIQTREQLIRILIAQRGLLIRFDISQEWLSNYLHIKRDTLSSWLTDLIENQKWLSIADKSYGKGYKAISYRAEHELAELIMNFYGYIDRKESYETNTLPTEIKDGEWHRSTYIASLKFQKDTTDENFIRWFKTIPGWDKKTRLKEAYDAFKCMKRYTEGLKDT